MRRILLLSASIFILVKISSAQTVPSDTSYWSKGFLSTLTFSQVSLTNWAAGGLNASSLNGFANMFADYRKDRIKWQNSLDLGYGFVKQGEANVQKSDDKINFVTKFGYQITQGNDKWFFAASLDFRTQFVEGLVADNPDIVISRFMAPGYLTIGTGIEFVPNEFLSFSYQPVTGKITFVNDEDIVGTEGAFGVEPGKTSRIELGSYFRFLYNQEVLKNVSLDTRLELFTSYEEESFGNIDVNWQTGLVMSINKYLSTNFFTQLLYDDDIKIGIDKNSDGVIDVEKKKIQFKSVFGIGLVYKIGVDRTE